MKYNYFILIGECLEFNSSYITLSSDNDTLMNIFLEEKLDLSNLEINLLTKIEGHIKVIEPGINVLVADKIYQIKKNYESRDEFVA